MKTKWKRIISGLLSAVMLSSVFPAAVATDETEIETPKTAQVLYQINYWDSSHNNHSLFADNVSKLTPAYVYTEEMADKGEEEVGTTIDLVIEDGKIVVPKPYSEEMTEEERTDDSLPYLYRYNKDGEAISKFECTSVVYANFDDPNADWIEWGPYGDPLTEWNLERKAEYIEGASICYYWEEVELTTHVVNYCLNIAEEGTEPEVGQLPARAQVYSAENFTEGSVVKYDLYMSRFSTVYDQSMVYPTEGKEGLYCVVKPSLKTKPQYSPNTYDDLLARETVTDEEGNSFYIYYQLLGWTLDGDDSGKIYEQGGSAKVGKQDMNFTAQWAKVDMSISDGPEVPFAREISVNGESVDAKISQKNSTGTKWTTEAEESPLELNEDRKVYYKAELSMNSLIAGNSWQPVLANRKITNPEFADFDIKVELDEELEPVTENSNYVVFTFTCKFLQPSENGIIKDENGKTIYSGGYTVDKNSYVYTVPASVLKNNTTFVIPMEWKPTEKGYTANELTSTITLEVAAAKVPGTEEKTISTTGVITGCVDMTKSGGYKEENFAHFLIMGDSEWRSYFAGEDGNVSVAEYVTALEHLRYAMRHITLDANTVWAHVDGPEPEPIEPEWETSKSKTATNLDDNFESQVTLSLPAAEKQLVSDVVFVLDKSTSATVEQQALKMLSDLKTQIDNTDAKVKVGVVIFNKQANVTNFMDLSTQYTEIETAIKQEIESGTNMHAGLLAGKAMLDDDTAVDADRKYLIFVSDGISYMYDADAKITSYYWLNDNSPYYSCDPYAWQFKYGNNNAPENWADWLSKIENINDNSNELPYADKASLTAENATYTGDLNGQYTTNVDRSLYKTWQVYMEAQKAGYHCYALEKGTSTAYAWGPSFMNYLADGKEVSFNDIQNDIYYLLGAGSKVVDVIGEDKYDNLYYYDFDFVNDIANLKLTRGGAELEKTQIDTTTYGFGDDLGNGKYEFILHYYANGSNEVEDEHFVWDINVPVSQFEAVALTYTVKLTNPQTADGKYGEYDEDGSEEYEGLYTNNSATLYPIDSAGNKVKEEEFPKPTVSYEVNDLSKLKNGFTIEKNVNGTGADYSKEFQFTVKLYETDGTTPLTGEYDYIKNNDITGKIATDATVTLKDGEGITIGNLPVGSKYVVTETAETNYTTTINTSGDVKDGNTATGTVKAGMPQRIQYINTHTAPVNPPTPSKEYAIEVTKSVDDTRPEVGDTVEYTVKIKNTGEETLTNIKVEDVMKDAAGSIKVDEDDLPKGVEYKGDGKFAIDELAAGKTITIEYTYKVKSADEDESITNTVTVKANGVSDKDSTTIRVREDDDDDDRPSRPSKPSSSSKPTLDTEDHYAYIVGMPDGLVHPEAEITRAEVATIFYRLLTEESRKELWTKENPYPDVTADKWYNVAVSVMSNGGIIHGYPDGTFKGGNSITRAEFATIAAQFLSSKYVGSDRFTDISGHWAAEYINRAAAEGWIAGYPDGSFRPNQNITRAEAMTLVNAVLGRTPDKDHLLRKMIEWPDNMVEGKWYYAQVQEATNSHEYERASKKDVEDWTELLEVRNWTEIERIWSDIYSSHNPGEVMAD